MIRNALSADAKRIVEIDRAVIGTDARRKDIAQAIIDGLCIVAETDHMLTGFAILSYHFFGNGFVDLLIVHPDCRRNGLGSELLRQCVAVCRTEKLFTSTNKSNLPMQALLRKAGFVFCGELQYLDEGDPELVYIAPLKGLKF